MNTYDTIWSYRQVPLTVYAFASVADWAITVDALSIGHTEGNPIMAQLSPAGMLVAKIVGFGLMLLCVWVLGKTEEFWAPGTLRRTTLAILWLLTLGQSAVVGWNVLVMVLSSGGGF